MRCAEVASCSRYGSRRPPVDASPVRGRRATRPGARAGPRSRTSMRSSARRVTCWRRRYMHCAPLAVDPRSAERSGGTRPRFRMSGHLAVQRQCRSGVMCLPAKAAVDPDGPIAGPGPERSLLEFRDAGEPAIRPVALDRQCIAQPHGAERWPASAVPARSRRASAWRRECVGFARTGRRRSGRSYHRPGAGPSPARFTRCRRTGDPTGGAGQAVNCRNPMERNDGRQRYTSQISRDVCPAPRTRRLRTRRRPFPAVSTRRAGSAAA